MKLKNIFLGLAAASIFAVSCNTFDQPAQSEYDDAVVFTSPTLTTHAINSIYDSYTVMSSYRTDWLMYYGANTDVEVWLGTGDDERNAVDKYKMLPTNSSLDKATWQYFYGGNMQGIERANIVISGLEKYADLQNDKELKHLYGEALTARALLYLDMLRYYGEVPARFEPITAETSYLPNVNTDIIYEQLLSDLKKAADNMEYGFTTMTTHAGKACAQGIYARIALQAAGYSLRCDDDKWNTGDPGKYALSNDANLRPEATYQTALDGLEEAIKNSGFILEENFSDIWLFLARKKFDAGHEPIFQFPFSDTRGQLVYHNGVSNEKYFKTTIRKGVNPALYFKYDKDDVRRDISCNPCKYGTDGKAAGKDIKCAAWYYGKWRSDWDTEVSYIGTDDGVKFAYLRMADMYLMASEIANELGQTEKAINYLRPIVARAFKNNPEKVDSYMAGLTDKESIFNAIKDQRAFEFVGEFLRKGDLIRWGILKDVLDETKVDLENLKNRKGKYSGWSNDVYWRYKANGIDIELFDPSSSENPTVTDPSGGWQKKSSYFSGMDSKLYTNLYLQDPIQNMWRPIPSTIIVSNMGVLKNDFGYTF